MIKIDKNVPMPEVTRGTGREPLYPFKTMKVRDSFVMSGSDNRRLMINIMSSASRHKPKIFTTRKEKNGVRCWRIK